MTGIRHLDAAEVAALLPPADAVAAVEAALRDGLDPAAGVPRSSVPLRAGSLLLMPAESRAHAGVKLATVAPGNPRHGLPRINALYVLFDAETLRPVALIDGTALTTLRTPAVSFAAVRRFLPGAPRVVVFGAGPQAVGHLATLSALTTPASVTIVTRSGALVARPEEGTTIDAGASTIDAGVECTDGSRSGTGSTGVGRSGTGSTDGSRSGTGSTGAGRGAASGEPVVMRAGSPEVEEALRAADLVVCATTAREPLFDSALLGPRTVVVAVGSHEPDAREVDAAFCARATVIVEDRATALRECGDVIQAIAEGALTEERLTPLAEAPAADGPVLFKGSGMSWQDLVIAEALLARA